MKRNLLVSLVVLLAVTCALAQSSGSAQSGSGSAPQTSSAPAPPPDMAAVLNRQFGGMEREFVPAVEAMPEEKFAFAPTAGEFKGVRTFAQQARHVAATNWEVAAAMLGEKPPVDTKGENENGPESIKSKADIVKYLKDSFGYAHKALSQVTPENATASIPSPFGQGKTTRLSLAVLLVGHGFDHYGQLVEYLRMNGIIPPASRPQ
jgi:uncharacterized damage-inducible protein DinB